MSATLPDSAAIADNPVFVAEEDSEIVGFYAEAVRDALTETVQKLPEHVWKSLT